MSVISGAEAPILRIMLFRRPNAFTMLMQTAAEYLIDAEYLFPLNTYILQQRHVGVNICGYNFFHDNSFSEYPPH